MSDYVYAVVLGIALAIVIRLTQRAISRQKARKRFPDLMQRWQTLGRRTRRSLTRQMRAGLAVPAEHAAIVIEMIDVSIAVEDELMPKFWRRVTRAYLVYVIILVGLAVAFVVSHASGRFIEVMYISAIVTTVVRLTIGVAQVRRRLQTWPGNRARVREQAVLDLSAVEPGLGV